MAATLDANKYMKYMAKYDMTEEQKVKFIGAMWNFAQNFVDKALNQHPALEHLENNKRDRFTSENKTGIIFMNWLYADLECRNS